MQTLTIRRIRAFIIDLSLLLLSGMVISFAFAGDDYALNLMQDLYANFNRANLSEHELLDWINQVYYVNQKLIYQDFFRWLLFTLYLVVLPLLNDGQTIGKKMMKIKIVHKSRPLSVSILLRRIIVSPIFSGLYKLMVILLSFGSSAITYYMVLALFLFSSLIINGITFIRVVLFGKTRGMHDLISGTEVVLAKD